MSGPTDRRQFLKKITPAGEEIYAQVGFQELDFAAVFGGKTRSSTKSTIGFGVQTFVLDYDDGRIVPGCAIEMTAIGTDCFQYGIVTDKRTDFLPASIDVLITQISTPVCASQDWEIQIINGFTIDQATIGFSATSLTFGVGVARGLSVSVITSLNKLFLPGSHLIFRSASNPNNFFRATATKYGAATGALTVFVTDVSSLASGASADWIVVAQDGTQTPAILKNYSTTSVNLTTLAIADVVAFTVTSTFAARKLYGSMVMIYSEANPDNFIIGQASGSDAASVYTVTVIEIGGSGTFTDWIIQPLTGPLGVLGSGLELYCRKLFVENTGSGGGVGRLWVNSAVDPSNGVGTSGIQMSPSAPNKKLSFAWADNYTVTVTANASLSGTNTGDQTVPSAATQAQMEAAASSAVFASPANMLYCPGVAKAYISFGITASATLAGSISSIDLVNDIITWTVAHGRATGDVIVPNGGVWPTGSTSGFGYYVRVISPTTFSLHPTALDATNNTNKVNLTAAGSGTRTMFVATYAVYASAGVTVVGIVGVATPAELSVTHPALSALNSGYWVLTSGDGLGFFIQGGVNTVTSSYLASGNVMPGAGGASFSFAFLIGDLA